MKIFNDATSPFGRKTVVAAMERAIAAEEVFVDLNSTALDRWNPLRQIPTLVLTNGTAIYDSDVIVQFLDRQHGGDPLIPADAAPAVLTRMSLANGLMEATLLRRVETLRPDGERSPAFIAKMEAKIGRVLEALSADLSALKSAAKPLRADQITTAVALGYVDFRFNDEWHGKHPALRAWYADIAGRRSMVLTAPTRSAAVPASEMTRG